MQIYIVEVRVLPEGRGRKGQLICEHIVTASSKEDAVFVVKMLEATPSAAEVSVGVVWGAC